MNKIKVCTCLRCGHQWAARKSKNGPKTCANPHCRSTLWNVAKRRKKAA